MIEIRTREFWMAILAECLGTIFLLFVGLSATVGDQRTPIFEQEIKVSLAFGLAFATIAQVVSHISGAHLNPAVTMGQLFSCRITIVRAYFYMVAQMMGAIVSSAVVYSIKPNAMRSHAVNQLNGISRGEAFGIEFMLTLQLVLCVLAVSDKRRNVGGFAPLAIGLSITAGNLAGISFTGCSINPARSLGPAVLVDYFDDHWVFWAGPMSAGMVAALLYNCILAPTADRFRDQVKVSLCCGSVQMSDTEPFLQGV